MTRVEASGFGRERRLRKRADFHRVQTTGARVNSAHYLFLVQARPAIAVAEPSTSTPARLGLVATKKLGNAVVRNRVKRICRACFRLLPGIVPEGVDLVVIPRPGAGGLGLEAALTEWRNAAKNLAARARIVLAKGAGRAHVPAAR